MPSGASFVKCRSLSISGQRGKVVREGLSADGTFGHSLECSESVACMEICGERAPGRVTSKCEGPEMGASLAFGQEGAE